MKENKKCPCCEKHCDLSAPACGRGRRYLETGEITRHSHLHKTSKLQSEHYLNADLNDKVLFNLKTIGHVLYHKLNEKSSQDKVLMILSDEKVISQRKLTHILGIQPSSVSEVLSKLEEEELITKTQNEEDKRNIDIKITELGIEKSKIVKEKYNQVKEKMFTSFNDDELYKLNELLEKLTKEFEHHHHHKKENKGQE